MAKAGQAEERRKERQSRADHSNNLVQEARAKLLEGRNAAISAGDEVSESLLGVAIDVVNRVFVKVK